MRETGEDGALSIYDSTVLVKVGIHDMVFEFSIVHWTSSTHSGRFMTSVQRERAWVSPWPKRIHCPPKLGVEICNRQLSRQIQPGQ